MIFSRLNGSVDAELCTQTWFGGQTWKPFFFFVLPVIHSLIKKYWKGLCVPLTSVRKDTCSNCKLKIEFPICIMRWSTQCHCLQRSTKIICAKTNVIFGVMVEFVHLLLSNVQTTSAATSSSLKLGPIIITSDFLFSTVCCHMTTETHDHTKAMSASRSGQKQLWTASETLLSLACIHIYPACTRRVIIQ